MGLLFYQLKLFFVKKDRKFYLEKFEKKKFLKKFSKIISEKNFKIKILFHQKSFQVENFFIEIFS